METNPVYDGQVLDLVRISAEYCKYLEQADTASTGQEAFIDTMRTLLPMIYLKASALRGADLQEEGMTAECVAEEFYDQIRAKVRTIMGVHDTYLEVAMEDFRYSDVPVACEASESLADLYHILRNFVEPFRTGNEEAMALALADLREDFECSWGQTLLNVLKALHDARFGARQY